MIKSMTGYGRGEWQGEHKRIEAEIRSFNHRYLDVSIRLPRKLNPLEGQVRNLLKQRVSRGRLEVSVQLEDTSAGEQKLELDLSLARDIHLALKTLQETLGLPGEIRLETLANFRDLFVRKEMEIDLEKEWTFLQITLENALTNLDQMRQNEGLNLKSDFLNRLKTVEDLAQQIAVQFPLSLKAGRDRLAERVTELSGGLEVDPSRLAQEVAFLAERSDITEELVRLKSHLNQFREMLDRPEPMGR
ncbi:MAG: YicC domain protein, partial [Deltaproteobacteria bacterium]|nr:YicC domain protein [Deltaproteobacteria bacterium]